VASGPPIEATVKWFKADKGFGFVELAEGAGDAFIHINALHAAGHEAVLPGTRLKVLVGQSAKGAQVTRVLEVDTSTATAELAPPRGGGGGGRSFESSRPPRFTPPDDSQAVEMTGTVKWFDDVKGFGFIASSDGGKDVFVHISVLRPAGVSSLAEGQSVSMRVVDTPKGREAISLSLP
jgi:CspA family cold shock protein